MIKGNRSRGFRSLSIIITSELGAVSCHPTQGTTAPITCCNIVQRFIISIHLHGFFFFLSLCELSAPLLCLWKANENIDGKKLQAENLWYC